MHTGLDHDQVLQRIYDAADEPSGFFPLVKELTASLNGGRCHMLLLSDAQVPLLQAWEGGTEEDIDRYNRDWREKDPRFSAGIQNLGKVLSDVEVIEPHAFERSAFYHDFMVAIGLRYTMFTTSPVYGGQILAMAFMREMQHGHYTPDQVRGLTRALPHIARAARLRSLLDEANARKDTLEAALDQLPAMLAVVDEQARVTFMNTGARRLLDEGDGLRWDGSRLSAWRTADVHALKGAVSAVARLADSGVRTPNESHEARSVRVERRDGSHGVVTLFPLRPDSTLRRVSDAGRVLCVLYDPARRPQLDFKQLGDLFSLTPTEAELANALVEGKSLGEFALARGTSIETVRTHMKRLLSKTDTRSQADFVRDVLGRIALQRLG